MIKIKTWLPVFALSLLVFCANRTFAQVQQLQFNPVLGTNGITLGKINSITRDKYGFMWLSDQSNRCIIRYDGTHMTRYQNNPKDSNTLGGYYPECLFADKHGNIWIGFYGMGLDKFDPVTKTFTHYRANKKDPASLSNDFVTAVLEDHLGNLWVGTYGGLNLLDRKTGKFKNYRNKTGDTTSLSCNTIRALYEDRAGELWVGTGFAFDEVKEGGLNRFHRDAENFTRYRSDPTNPQTLVNDKVRAIFEDSRGTFWVGTKGDGLHTMDRKTGAFTRHRYDPASPSKLSRGELNGSFDHITFITEDAENKIWIGTLTGGTIRYDPVADTFRRYGSRQERTGLLKDSTSWCAYATTEGYIWLSTQNANLFKINLYSTILPKFGDQHSDRFFSFCEDGTNLRWVATNNGLLRKDVRTGNTQRFLHEPGNPNSLTDNQVYRIIMDKQGNLWIGTNNGLNELNTKTGKFTRYYLNPNNPEPFRNSVVSLYEDSDSNIWAGMFFDGLAMLDRQTGKWTIHRNDPSNASTISDDAISTIIAEDSTQLWLGTYNNGGLNKMNRRTGKCSRYLPGLIITCLYRDSMGILWVGTPSGLFRYNKDSDVFNTIAEENSGNNIVQISGITGDKANNLWIATESGLYTLNKKRDQVIHYGREYGIADANNFFFDGAASTMTDGEIYFGYDGGYLAFDPGKLQKGVAETRLYFTGFWLNNKEVVSGQTHLLQASLYDAKDIHLNHNQNVFSLSTTIVDFRNNGDKRIFYKLENYDKEWRTSGPEDRIHYFKVPPGDYIFQVKTANPTSGEWIEKSMNIFIAPPWWTTWWAYSIYGLLFIAGSYFLHKVQKERVINAERERTRMKELAQAKEIEKAYNELRTTQSLLIQSEKMASLGELTAGIAHEIQNPLNFVNNFSEVNSELVAEMKTELSKGNIEEARAIADDIDDNEKKISHHGKRADAIVKSMLQHSRSSTGTKEPTNLNKLVDEYVRLAYHGLRAKDKSFNVTLNTQYDDAIGNLNIIPQDIGRVLLNLINNAFYTVTEKKKSPQPLKGSNGYEPTVTIQTSVSKPPSGGRGALISISDNGNGIPPQVLDKIFQPFFTTKPTGQGTGLGLSLAYDIVKAHGGEIKVESTEAVGTTFIVEIPAQP